jgi:hypothetical protein
VTYPHIANDKDERRLPRLRVALQNRLEAIAARAQKDALQVRITKALIFVELGHEQSKLVPPSVAHQVRTEKELRNWRAAKGRYQPLVHREFAAKLVRKASLRLGVRSRRYPEADTSPRSLSNGRTGGFQCR